MFGHLNRGTAPGFAHYSLTVPAGTVCWGYSFAPHAGEALWDSFLDGDPPSYTEIGEVRREESSSPAISYESREVGRGAGAQYLAQNGYWEANVTVMVELSDAEAGRVARRLAETDEARVARRAVMTAQMVDTGLTRSAHEWMARLAAFRASGGHPSLEATFASPRPPFRGTTAEDVRRRALALGLI